MGKGLLPDTHELAATGARSLAIGKCDVALVLGARLNWLLHLGEPPKLSKDVNFLLVDICEEEIDLRKSNVGFCWGCEKGFGMIHKEINNDPFCLGKNYPWVEAIVKRQRKMLASPGRFVVSVEGDSGFRFSALEVEAPSS
ncbi:unnamed protein product [Ilex paraguariensis]|uniref:Thiamine pyrophosphate enzyme central domain-containing protein n=1 Tax=Ilex paraguariensis TaxID=185542 RepID=A0ABC8R4T3_9AQUA